MSRRLKFYLAAPLFNNGERTLNLDILATVSPWLDLHVPQLHGALLTDLQTNGFTYVSARDLIFKEDVAAIRSCDGLLIVLNGSNIDDGAAFELGVAWALGKPCFGFKDDVRQLLPGGDNPMISGALKSVFGSLEDLAIWAYKYRI